MANNKSIARCIVKDVLLTTVTALLLFQAVAYSQSSNASLGGAVQDSNQMVIPLATVSARNLDTGIVATTRTNTAGNYYFAALQSGSYDIRAAAPGFRPRTYQRVYLGSSQQIGLNFGLVAGVEDQPIESPAELGEVQAASTGSVLMTYSLDGLPTGGGNALDLVASAPGTLGSNFAGGRVNLVNTTRDGISVKDGRYDNGVYSQTYVSTDLINEVRILIAPADAETGRGSGQVRLTTRSGTNQFHGSAFWSDRNSALDANNWFNNFNGMNKNYLNRNQFGARLAGPITENKTFFFVLYEGMRTVQKEVAIADVLTAEARQGLFRYFPGVQNNNARSSNPTVDLQGNPVRPANATGPLTSFNVFGRSVQGVFTPWDPLRPGPDPTGLMQRIYQPMPLPNDFTAHDGLNMAHYRWMRRRSGTDDVLGSGIDINRDQLNIRIDHYFNSNHRLNLSASREHTWADNNMSNLPGGFNGQVTRHPQVYTASLVSALKGTLVNEFRFGLRRGKTEDLQAYDVPGKTGEEARKYLGQNNGTPYIVVAPSTLILNYWFNDTGGSRANVVPLYSYSDTMAWIRGRHALKGGLEFRFGSNNAWNSDRIIPRVTLGAGVPVTGIDGTTIPGLVGSNLNFARILLTELAGSVASIDQAFSLAPDPNNIVFRDYRELYHKVRDIHQNEWSAFFKDDWKIRPNLTFNLGLRYEYFGVPYESHGLTAAPVGGGGIITTGSLAITPELIGKGSRQPEKQLYKDDWNNFAPAVGVSWALPYWGRDKTVIRAGYGISYQGGGRGLTLDTTIGSFPGVNQFISQRSASYMDLTRVSLPIPGKVADGQLPVVPLTARNDVIYTWDPNMVTPYIQNSTLEIQRTISKDFTMSARYIGTKGTKLFGFIEQNYQNITTNGLLDAMTTTREGGNAALFDKMLNGLDMGLGPVNGSSVTGSASLRQNSTTSTPLANGNFANVVNYLNTTANFTASGPGGLLRNGGFPEDFIAKNPQFLDAYLHTNPGNSTYHSLQLSLTAGPVHGFSNETTYTWSRALGEADDDGVRLYFDPSNRSLDKSLLSFHRTHDLRSDGTLELPLGPGKFLLGNAPPFLSRIVERWQLGAMFNMSSGAPLTLTSLASPYSPAGSPYGAAVNFPDIVGNLPRSFGKVTRVANGVVYFDGLKQINDPSRSTITSMQNLANAATLLALEDSKHNVVLQNPKPGRMGTLGRNWLQGPGHIGLDVDLAKRVGIGESQSLELRVDALNVLNHPQFGSPIAAINNPGFGQINIATGNRMFTFSARLSF